jgi:hypothetical protein
MSNHIFLSFENNNLLMAQALARKQPRIERNSKADDILVVTPPSNQASSNGSSTAARATRKQKSAATTTATATTTGKKTRKMRPSCSFMKLFMGLKQ